MVNSISLIEYDSSDFSDITDSIQHSKSNKLVYSRLNSKVTYANKYDIDTNFILDKYDSIIIENTKLVKIDENYFYKPEYLSKKLYGTPNLWYLLLFVNSITTAMEFNKNRIYIFDPNRIHIFNKLIENDKERIKELSETPYVIEDLTIKKVNLLE